MMEDRTGPYGNIMTYGYDPKGNVVRTISSATQNKGQATRRRQKLEMMEWGTATLRAQVCTSALKRQSVAGNLSMG